MLVGLPGSHTTDVVAGALAKTIASLPEQLRRSLTWDQGKEMAEQITSGSGTPMAALTGRSFWAGRCPGRRSR